MTKHTTMSKNQSEPTIRDVLQAVNNLNIRFTGLDNKFNDLGSKFTNLDGRFSNLDQILQRHITESEQTHADILSAINGFANHTEQRFIDIEGDIKHIKNVMVTKDYLDDKLADQKRRYKSGYIGSRFA